MPNRIVHAPGEGDCFFHVVAFFEGHDILDAKAARECRKKIAEEAARVLFEPPYDSLGTLTKLVKQSTGIEDLAAVRVVDSEDSRLLQLAFDTATNEGSGNGSGCPLPAFVVWLQYSSVEVRRLGRKPWARWLRETHRFLTYTLWGDAAFSTAILHRLTGRAVVFHPHDGLSDVRLDPEAYNFVASPNHFDAAVFEEEGRHGGGDWRHTPRSLAAPDASTDTSHLEIHHLDVGQGDSTLLLLKTGERIIYSLLVDGGDAGQAPLIHDYMGQAGVKSLDCMVISHYDADHCNGAIELLTRSPLCQSTQLFDRGEARNEYDAKGRDIKAPLDFVMGGQTRHGGNSTVVDDREFDDPVEELRARLHRVAKKRMTAGRRGRDVVGEWLVQVEGLDVPTFSVQCVAANGFVLDGTEVTPLHADQENTYSICLLVRFETFSYLLCGDATGEEGHDLEGAVAAYLRKGLDHVCAMKVSHHGSHHSTKQAYVDTLNPRAAFISTGVHRKHQHPRQEPIDVLQSAATVQNFYLSNCGYKRQHISPAGEQQHGRARVAGDERTLGTVILRVDHSVAELHVFWVGYWDRELDWRLMRHCCVEPKAHEELFGVSEEDDDHLLVSTCPVSGEAFSDDESSDDEDLDPETRILLADEIQKQRTAVDERLVRHFGLRAPRPRRAQSDGTESAPPREAKTIQTDEMLQRLDDRYDADIEMNEQRMNDEGSDYEDESFGEDFESDSDF